MDGHRYYVYDTHISDHIICYAVYAAFLFFCLSVSSELNSCLAISVLLADHIFLSFFFLDLMCNGNYYL